MRVSWDSWTLDIPARRIEGADGPVHVEPQVFDVLAYLVTNRDRVVPKEELLDGVWGDQFVSESALTSRIKSLRRALGDDGRTQRYVRNVHGRGYQFVGEIADAHTAPVGAGDIDLALAVSLDDEFPFVGRREELDHINATLSSPGLAVVFIGGEPGIGKSRLGVEALRRRAEAGAMVCAGRCEEHVAYALQPIRDALAQLATMRPAEFRAWAAGMEPQLVGLMPGLIRDLDAEPLLVDGYAAIEVLTTLVERATDTAPLVILLDDLHWSDEPTRALVARLGRRLADRPISVVATYRSTGSDLPAEVGHWMKDQVRRNHSLTVELEGLDLDATRELVASVLGADSDSDADELQAQTGGHGLFLTESLRDMQHGAASASSVQTMVSARLDRLAEPVRNIVRAGAVLGPEFAFDVAAAGADLDHATALGAIDQAVDAELLHATASPSRFRFSHALVPEAIRTAMTPRASAVIHHRCAKALRRSGADDVEVAFHLLGAVPLTDATEAIAWSCRAVDSAIDNHEFDRAIRLLERVLAASPDARTRADALLQIGWALVAAGRAVAAVPHFEEAAELRRHMGWDDVVVEAALGHYGRSPYRNLRDNSTLQLLAEADGLLGSEPSVAKARVLAKTAVFSQFMLPLKTCDEMTQRALDMVPDADPAVRMELLESREIVFTCPAGVSELEALERELAGLRRQYGVYFADAATPEAHLYMLHRGAELRAAARTDENRVQSQPIAEWRDMILTAMLAAFAGNLHEARRLCNEAGAIGEQFWGDSAHVVHALGHAFIGALGGGWDRAAQLFDRLLSVALNQYIVIPAAWVFLAAGDEARGRQLARSIRTSRFARHGEHILGGNILTAATEVALMVDDDDLAAATETHLKPFEDLMLGLPWAPAFAAADSLCRLAERRGDADAAAEYKLRARRVYEDLDAPVLLERLG